MKENEDFYSWWRSLNHEKQQNFLLMLAGGQIDETEAIVISQRVIGQPNHPKNFGLPSAEDLDAVELDREAAERTSTDS
jgi:hypothetical protein